MTTMNKFGSLLGAVGVLALSGCATTSPPANTNTYNPNAYNPAYNPTYNPNAYSSGNTYQDRTQSRSAYPGYGVVQSIDTVKQDYKGVGGTGFGLGTVAGAVIGGVVGHQLGSGRGNTVATVAGSAGGAYVGHQLEKRNQAPDAYAFTVRMDGGSYQTTTQATTAGLRVGDRVRIDNGFVQRY